MTSARVKKKLKEARRWAVKQYERHRRHNVVYAKPGTNEFIIILDNLKPSFNIGKIFRSSDVFGAKEIHLIGIDYFDVRSAKGTFKWVKAHFHKSFADCYEQLHEEAYSFFTLEPTGDVQLHRSTLPKKCAFVFGHEEYGISFDPLQYEELTSLSIAQLGKVESLNVSVAASVVMYEYFRQHCALE